MLIIKEKQIQHFIAADENELIGLVSGAIRLANPERISDYDDEKLTKMVKIGIERARSHELERAEDITAFVAVMFEISPEFDEQTEIKQWLNDPTFPADARFYQLFERISAESWEEAERLYESAAWFPGEFREN